MRLVLYIFLISQFLNFLGVFAEKVKGDSSEINSVTWEKVDNNKWQVFTHNGKNPVDIPPIEIAKTLCDHGAGELVIYSIDKDGTGLGYDLDLIDLFRDAVDVPITAVGGAGSLEDISTLITFPVATAEPLKVAEIGLVIFCMNSNSKSDGSTSTPLFTYPDGYPPTAIPAS